MNNPQHKPGSKTIVGSPGSGKSYETLRYVIGAAEQGDVIINGQDPHQRALAWDCYRQLTARGHERRTWLDRLSDSKHALKIRLLPRSRSRDPIARRQENERSVHQFLEACSRRRDAQSLVTNPLTYQWANKASMLVVEQDCDRPARYTKYAFRPKHQRFTELLDHCIDPELAFDFRQIASGAIKPGLYAPAQRLFDDIFGSTTLLLRDGTDSRIEELWDNCDITLWEGGSDIDDTCLFFGCLNLNVFHYLRNRWRPTPRFLHVMDEANNARQIGAGGHEVQALAELRKAGYDGYIIVQSLNFPTTQITQDVLATTIEHHWFYNSSDAVCRAGAADLGDPDYRQRIRGLRRGQCFVKRLHDVWLERVPAVDEPWVFPGLAARKAYQALTRLHHRPELEIDPCLVEEFQPSSSEQSASLNSPISTSSPPSILRPSSPAKRLRIEKSKRSAKRDDSAASAAS